MNRSYSKIRHIQEANLRLERRVIIEAESDTDNSSMEPTQQELILIQKDSNKDEKRILGKKLVDLYLATQPPSTLREWLEQNGYKKLIKLLSKISEKYSQFGEGVLTADKLTWLGGKYFNDSTLKSNVARIESEHIKEYNDLHKK